jgi:predicted alpha-1,6-mannanase (GH76 family)
MKDYARPKTLAAGMVLCGLMFNAGNAALAPGDAALAPGDDFNAHLETAAAALQRWYNHRGLWDTTDWWNAANCVEALEDVVVANNGQSYLEVPANTFHLNSQANFLNDYYDDEGWWALAWIRAYDLTGQEPFLKMAKTIFADMTTGWGEPCGGGLRWRKSADYKNAIPNELFLLVAVRLHQRTPGDDGAGSYLDWAIREWNWFRNSGMINRANLINDGLTRNCENNGRTTWTYNQGVILGGLTDLYKATGDTNYLAQATAIANAAIARLIDTNGILREPCETGDCRGGDVPQFKGIFIRYLAYLHDVTRKPEYSAFLFGNARSVWANDRDAANHLGLRWTGPFDRADAARHSSAMFALAAVTEPATRHLPFAKGAASASFHHTVGGPTGTLAWTCNAVNATQPGVILSGPYAQLPAGTHVAHFRMAVDRVGPATNALARLEIHDGTTVITAREVALNSFKRVNESRDFELAFTNHTAGDQLEFRAHWHAAPGAPALTLTDVTIDGGLNWTAANLAHEIGRLDGSHAWCADPVRDRASGFLVTGPGTRELAAGNCSAAFELKVDNFNLDDSVVATIFVVETGGGKIIASRDLKRSQFPNTLYQTFTLEFNALAGGQYDFRTFWQFAPHAPRLTQRSVVVKSGPHP